MGQEPRKFDATRGVILANLSELLVRQIEARWASQARRKCEAGHLKRAADAYNSATGFIDASDPRSWRVLHLNGPAVELLGKEFGPFLGMGLVHAPPLLHCTSSQPCMVQDHVLAADSALHGLTACNTMVVMKPCASEVRELLS